MIKCKTCGYEHSVDSGAPYTCPKCKSKGTLERVEENGRMIYKPCTACPDSTVGHECADAIECTMLKDWSRLGKRGHK